MFRRRNPRSRARKRSSLISYRTLKDTRWHDQRRGFFTIPSGTECEPVSEPNARERKAMEKAREQGQTLIPVKLMGKRRLLKKQDLEPVIL